MSVTLSRTNPARVPKPLEQVKALVCEQCWTQCFDIEGFEKFGRGEADKFECTVNTLAYLNVAVCPDNTNL